LEFDLAQTIKVDLTVPGPWSEKKELFSKLMAESPGRYSMSGPLLLDNLASTPFDMEFHAADKSLIPTFNLLAPHGQKNSAATAVAEHKSVCVIRFEAGSLESVKGILETSSDLLAVGGLAVIVESSAVAHSPEQWSKLCKKASIPDCHTAFVTEQRSKKYVYTRGMHSFGLPDAVVSLKTYKKQPDVLRIFAQQLLKSVHKTEHGQSYSLNRKVPCCRISEIVQAELDPAMVFSNPFGSWLITPS